MKKMIYLYFKNINKMCEKEFKKLFEKNIKLPLFDIKLLDINILQQFLKQSNIDNDQNEVLKINIFAENKINNLFEKIFNFISSCSNVYSMYELLNKYFHVNSIMMINLRSNVVNNENKIKGLELMKFIFDKVIYFHFMNYIFDVISDNDYYILTEKNIDNFIERFLESDDDIGKIYYDSLK
jgi:hypothetical protein